jgi:hypothetical protein
LTAETVIDALEDAEDYATFEIAVTVDYDAQSAVGCGGCVAPPRIESGLFKIQAKHLLQFRQRRQVHQKRQEIIKSVYRNALATEEDMHRHEGTSSSALDPGPSSTVEPMHETFLDVLRSDPLALWRLPYKLIVGRAAVKEFLAGRSDLDVETWPVREDLLATIGP